MIRLTIIALGGEVCGYPLMKGHWTNVSSLGRLVMDGFVSIPYQLLHPHLLDVYSKIGGLTV